MACRAGFLVALVPRVYLGLLYLSSFSFHASKLSRQPWELQFFCWKGTSSRAVFYTVAVMQRTVCDEDQPFYQVRFPDGQVGGFVRAWSGTDLSVFDRLDSREHWNKGVPTFTYL